MSCRRPLRAEGPCGFTCSWCMALLALAAGLAGGPVALAQAESTGNTAATTAGTPQTTSSGGNQPSADQNQPSAHQNQSSANQPQQGELQNVEVTARYMRENLQTTPLAITALSGVQLEDRAVTNTTDLGAVVPNLYTHPGDAEEGPTPTISMRGVTAGDYSFEGFPAVGIYIDDIYHSTMVGSAVDLTDVDRIEVNRGPQGTLAGNSSIAGSIDIYTKEPKGDDSGHFSAAYGSYNDLELAGAYDASLIPDTLFMRVSGVSHKQDGYVDQLDFTCEMQALGTPALAGSFPTSDNSAFQRNCVTGAFGGTDLGAAKARFRFLASDKLTLDWSISRDKEDDEVPAEVLTHVNPSPNDGFDSVYSAALLSMYNVVYGNQFLPPPGRPYSSYATTCRPLLTSISPSGFCFSNSEGQDSTDGSIVADYRASDDVDVKAIYGYGDYGGYLHQPGDVSPLGYVEGEVYFRVVQQTYELRATGSAFDHKLDWVAGAFDLQSTDHLSGAIDFVVENFEEDDHYHNDAHSGFFHTDFHVTDRFDVAAGLRYSTNSSEAELDHQGLLTGVIPFSVSASRFDWLASLSYKLTDNVMLYTTEASGYRPPGITTIVNSIYQLQAVPEEELVSYEGGIKSEFFDHRLRLNLDGFYSDYSKKNATQIEYQCLAQKPPPSPVPLPSDCPVGGDLQWYITVSTPATIRGAEFELTAEPIDDLLLNWSGGYNHFVDGVTTPGKPGYIVPGNLPMPELNSDAGIQYTLHAFGWDAIPRLDWVYQSKSTFDPESSLRAPLPLYTIGGYGVLNTEITFQPTDSKWSAQLACRNCGNKYYFYELFTGSTVAVSGVVGPPREFVFTLSRQF